MESQAKMMVMMVKMKTLQVIKRSNPWWPCMWRRSSSMWRKSTCRATTSTWEKDVIINTSSSPRLSTSPRRRWSRRGGQGKKQLSPSVSGQVVENQVLVAQVMNQKRTSPPVSCKVLHHHHTCALWPKVWRAM
jgi:hypothetical protein